MATEQDLWAQAAKLKEIYANNLNTQKQNSVNDMNASKQAYVSDANNQLGEQKSTTANTVADADINAFNNAKQLREMAAAGGYSNGGELFSGTIQNEQQKGNQIGNANNIFAKYKKNWDDQLNQYNNSYNNKLNALNSETANKINEYNVNTDYDFQGKIDQMRAQQAAEAAAAAKASELSKTEMYDLSLQKLNEFMDSDRGYIYLHDYKDDLINSIGQVNYDKLSSYFDKNSSDTDYQASISMSKVKGPEEGRLWTNYLTEPQGPAVPAGLNTQSTSNQNTTTTDTKNDWFNKLSSLFVK